MKRLFCVLALAGIFFASCKEVVECDKQHYETECNKEHMPEVAPTIAVAAGEATVESISFVLTPEMAAAVRYSVVEAGAALPSAEDVFNQQSEYYGIPADATIEDEYVVSGLELGTDYTVVAAAKNNIGYSEVASLSMTTLIPEMKLTLAEVKVGPNSITFSISPVNASKVAYVVLPEGESLPEASAVLANGTEVAADAAGEYVAAGLEQETSYQVVAAALDLAGKNAMLSEVLSVTTTGQTPPAVGDYYYSDGSWSTEIQEGKTPIGVVFYVGCATEMGDNKAYYKVKDGKTAMSEFHGYVVALKDASPAEGVWWSFYNSWADPCGISTDTDDFLGYTNTLAIRSHADQIGVGFSKENTSYPAAWYATEGFESVCPAPEQSSGWFLPSAGQLMYIWNNAYFNPTNNLKGWVENSLRNLGDLAAEMYAVDSEYWTSNEQVDSYATSVRAYYVSFDSSQFQPGFVSWLNKDWELRVRSVLAF